MVVSGLRFYSVLIIIIFIINAKIPCILVQNVSSSNHGFGGPIFAVFDTLEFTYASHGVRDIP